MLRFPSSSSRKNQPEKPYETHRNPSFVCPGPLGSLHHRTCHIGGSRTVDYTSPTTTFLRSPVIDLSAATSAQLAFAEAVDFAATDSAEVYVISESDDSVIAGPIHTSSTGAIRTVGWATANGGAPIALPPAALGQPIRLEWRFTGGTDAFLGWYIDDVTVSP